MESSPDWVRVRKWVYCTTDLLILESSHDETMTSPLQYPYTTDAIYLSIKTTFSNISYDPRLITFFNGMLNIKLTHQRMADSEILDRVVPHIYTIHDPRPKGQRPLAAEIFLSFWYYEIGAPIESLNTIFLQKVQENTMEAVRRHVYNLMGERLSERLLVQRGGSRYGENDSFELTYHTTKFGRCARTMETENLVMWEFGIKVAHFEFDPRLGDPPDPRTGEPPYNVIIEFAVDHSHHLPHGGYQGHY